MKPFVDSQDVLDQPAELRERMSRDGYLFISSLLPRQSLTAIHDAILDICRQKGWADAHGRAIGRPRPEGDPEYWEVYDPVQRLESFHALAHQPEIIGVIEAIVQELVLAHPRNIARIGPPNAQRYTTPPHQDFVLIQATPETYTAWIPLRDCPVALGNLAVLSGSHTLGILPVHKADGPGGVGVDTDQFGLEWHDGDFACGDTLIFHSMTVDRALPNLTPDQIRISADYRYQGMSQPIVHDGLDPHYNRLSWSMIYQGW